MKTIKYFIVLCCINFSFGSEGGGFFEQWFMPDTALFLWSVVTFLIVLGILRWKAWGPLIDVLDARAKQIEESLSKAEKVTADAEQQAVKNEEILNAARKEAQNIVTQARDAGDTLKRKLEEDGKEQYNSILEKAKEQIDTEKQKALSEIKTTVVDIALKASERVIKRNLTNEDNKKIVEQTIDEFKRAN
jgi:F-type H+-transporting ATPase subunit b